MASVAAAIDSGRVIAPRLVSGAKDDRIVPMTLPANVAGDLRAMMGHVVQSGTAAGAGLPAGTHAKTGTAQYGPSGAPRLDGWLMGYRGDVAFAIVTQDTGGVDGGPIDGPIIARFLDRLGDQTQRRKRPDRTRFRPRRHVLGQSHRRGRLGQVSKGGTLRVCHPIS